MVRDGVLPPAKSGELISKHLRHVRIHQEGIEKLCEQIMSSFKDGKLQVPDTNTCSIHPDKLHPNVVDWVFVVDALNFCFWSRCKEEQWTVEGHTGYYALEAALKRALREGHNITNPEYYSRITDEELTDILRGDTKAEIPLFKERLAVLHEVGRILIEKYNKTFVTCVREADKSAENLLKIIVSNFPCFQDEVQFEGHTVSFYKRAQILVADLWNFLEGSGLGEFKDIDTLTIFADYRVPQVLVHFGAMSYSDELTDTLKKDILLPSGSQEEIEIRGCSIHTVELMKLSLQERINRQKLTIKLPNASLLDYFLWSYRRVHAAELEAVPYHKTLGIYY